MNWNSKYVSVKQVIGKVYRDLGLSDQINFADAVEWAGEAIELIGAPFHFVEKVERIVVANYKAHLPCDLHYIETSSGLPTDDTSEEACASIDTSGFRAMRYSTDSYHHWYCGGSSFKDNNCSSDLTYKVNDNYLFPNFETGFVLLSYKGIPTDDDGYPRIPDDIKFKEAVSAHIKWKLDFIALRQGKISQGIYQISTQERDWYIGAAQTRANMPSVDMAESIKNNFVRMIPKINQHADGFKGAGGAEQRYTHNSGSSQAGTKGDNNNSDNTYFHIDK